MVRVQRHAAAGSAWCARAACADNAAPRRTSSAATLTGDLSAMDIGRIYCVCTVQRRIIAIKKSA